MKPIRKIFLAVSAIIALSAGSILIFADITNDVKKFVFIALITSMILLLLLLFLPFREEAPDQNNLMFSCLHQYGDIPELNDLLEQCDHREDLISYITSIQIQKSFSNAEVCRKGCIDKSNYSNLINRKKSKPTKETVIKIAYGLELSLEEAKMLLNRAGYSFNESERFDTIIQYCLANRLDTFDTDDILNKYGFKTLFAFEKKSCRSDHQIL